MIRSAVRNKQFNTVKNKKFTNSPVSTPFILNNGKFLVTIGANFYPQVKKYLQSGDRVVAVAVRNQKDMPVLTSKFKQAVEILNPIDVNEKGVVKIITFSSVADLEKYLYEIPQDVNWVGYNTEKQMTPDAETGSNMLTSLKKFKSLTKSRGFKMSWGPIYADFDVYEKRGMLSDLVKEVDGIGLQGQKILANNGIETFVVAVKSKNELFTSYNPEIKLFVQLVIGMNSNEDIIEGFSNVSELINSAVIFTLNDPESLEEILASLRSP